MNKTATLTSLAMLKVNADVENRDYADYVAPFVSYVLTRHRPSPITAYDVQGLLKAEFGLSIPQHATEFILRRLVKRKILRRDNYVYILATDTFPVAAVDASRQRARQEQEELLSAIRAFVQSSAGVEWTVEEAQDALLAYLASFSIQCLRTYSHGTALPSIEAVSDKAIYLFNTFIRHAHDVSHDDFAKIVTIVKGHMLANALMCEDLSSLPRNFGGVRFFIDSPLVLRALGLEGEPKRLAVVEVFELIARLKGHLAIFEHTREEVYGVIRGAEGHLDDPLARGRIIEEMRRAGRTRSDLTLLAGRLDDRLRGLGLQIRPTPKYTKEFQIDEKVLEGVIGDEVHYINPRALEYDVNSIRSIYGLREGATPHSLEDAAAVLVTSNAALARAAFEFGREFESTREVSSVIADFSLANIAWLKAPLAAPDLPKLEVMASCYAALRPPDALWSKYIVEIDRLETQGGMSARDHEVLRYSLKARDELMNLTGGAEEEFTPRTIPEILERVKADLVAEQKALLDRQREEHEIARDEWRKNEELLRGTLGQRAENERGLRAQSEAQQAALVAERRALDERLREWATTLTRIVGRGLVAVLAAAVAWHALSERLEHWLGDAAPWAAALGSSMVTLGILLLVIHGVVGISAKEIVKKAEGHLRNLCERMLRRFVLGETERKSEGEFRGPTDL